MVKVINFNNTLDSKFEKAKNPSDDNN